MNAALRDATITVINALIERALEEDRHGFDNIVAALTIQSPQEGSVMGNIVLAATSDADWDVTVAMLALLRDHFL